MKRFFFLLILSFPFILYAQQPEKRVLWPDDIDNGAEIFVYLPSGKSTSTPVVLICPGGGYSGLAMEHEGHDMAKWYIQKGIAAIVLKYRMPNGKHAIPLMDAEKAMETIRDKASQWNINKNKVGVIGSSAGGHLAASLSTLASDKNRPDFAILYYPVISFDDMTTHGGSKKNLLGDDINNVQFINRYSLEKQVDEKTPKTLLLLSDDDEAVIPQNSILYYSALKKKNISAAMYIFPMGGHGWGFRDAFPYHGDMKVLIMKWLEYIQVL